MFVLPYPSIHFSTPYLNFYTVSRETLYQSSNNTKTMEYTYIYAFKSRSAGIPGYHNNIHDIKIYQIELY